MASTGWQQPLLHSQYILSSSPVAPNVLSPRKWSPTRQPNPNRVTKRPINENRFPFPIPILESRYRLCYPSATPRTVQRATILIDEIFARIRNYPVESLRNNLLEYLPYCQAVTMEHQERVLWDQLGLYTDLRLLDEVIQHITPQEADDCRNILQS